ncbi:MAG: glycosyl hydrolase [Planctomycetes bacterium]|nr:glycosyl hydrolase [Planctomycetota bacterium]
MKHPITLITALLLALRATLHAADTFDHATIVGLMRQTNDWQTAHPRMQPDDRNWERGTWFTGIMAAHKATGDEKYLTQAMDWGRQHQWQVGTEISGANKLFCSMTWLELFLLIRDEVMIQPTVNWLATHAPNSPGGAEVWFRHQPNHSDSPLYSDSLYAMPALAMLHQATGETKYLDILHHFSKAVTEELLDPQDGLYYRDRSFIGKRTPAGRKVFWSRGNGWVFAGLPRTIEFLPADDPERARYVELFKTLAAAIAKCQGADGLWRPNLADPDHIPVKETSGTAFFCYGMAWGIRNGLLDRETYLPVTRKAWAALAASVNAEGMIQWGQQVGDRPAEVRQDQTHEYVTGGFLLAGSEMLTLLSPRAKPDPLAESFSSPPDSARPGVYWYFMDGNQSREGMTADLEAMHRAGLRTALFLEVNIGVPRGPVNFMSEPWQDNFAHAVRTADRLGMEIILGTGPGWCGAGGPWIDPARSMQHLCSSTAKVSGPGPFTGILPVPEPRKPSEFAGLSPALAEQRQAWHADVTVLAFPTPAETAAPDLMDVRALYDTQPYSSYKHVTRFIPTHAAAEPPAAAVIDPAAILDLSQRLRPDGTLDWQVPPGAWTVMRFAARSTGVTTRPAPDPGHGFESDRFDPAAFDYHFEQFHRKLMDKVGPRRAGRGWTALHLDSWESSSQNWSATLREEFKKRRGYDPQPYFPAYAGLIVGSRDKTERFLWDLRMTAAELVLEKHAGVIRQRAHEHGFYYTSQFYDMNPAGDLDLGAVADIPSCEFWSGVLDTVYSCVEAVSVAHTMGRPVVRAEAFTSMPQHGYRDNPADMKSQTDWALAMGINDFIIHTYQHQPLGLDGPRPGLAMGPHGIHWHRNQTFWPLVAPYHDYMARCGQMLRQGVSVADILYLTPEGAPHIFLAPEDAMSDGGLLRDKKGHGFDAVSPRILISRASVRDGMIAFDGGTSYRVLVMPLVETMTPELLGKIRILIRDGASVIGTPPGRSPSLAGFPQCDERVKSLANEVWGGVTEPAAETSRPFGKGRVVWGGETTRPGSADKLYPSYASTAAFLQKSGVPVVLESPPPLRWHQRRTPERDIFFVANPAAGPVEANCVFRTDGAAPELWNAVDGSSRPLPEHTVSHGRVAVPLRLAANESCFVVFNRTTRDSAPAAGRNFAEMKPLAAIDGPWSVSFDAALGGPNGPVEFPKLSRWDRNPDDAIKYYSGQAVYRSTFQSPEPPANARVFLDLGAVHKLARVTLNGGDLGTVWTPPYRVEVTGKLKPGPNLIEVAVVNTWVNRLIGDEQPANKGTRTLKWDDGMLGGTPHPAGRYTFTTARDYTAESPLQESGLLGPVHLLVSE